MSKYRKIDCVGWWEDEDGHRIKVIGLDSDIIAFLYQDLSCGMLGQCLHKDLLLPREHLPDCNDWKWQPEPKIEEIEFPDWILPGWNYVTRDRNGVWVYQSTPQLDLQSGCWTFGDSHFSQKLNRAIDCSWVPDTDDWTKAVWQRKPKQDDGWIEWEGSSCPVSSQVKVEIKKRNGGTCTDIADLFYWHTCYNKPSDIVAYRVIE